MAAKTMTPQPIALPDNSVFGNFSGQPIDSQNDTSWFGGSITKPVNNTQPSGNETNFWNTDVGKEMARNQAANQGAKIAMPIGQVGMQSTMADKPANYTSPEELQMKQMGSAVAGGLSAGSNIQATPDSQDALLQVAGAGLSGAAVGAAAGGPAGAAFGGIVGLVSGGLNAWVGTHSARQNRRQAEKVNMQIQAREDARHEQDRQDQLYMFNSNKEMSLEQLRFNRRAAAVQESFQAQEHARRTLNDAIANDQNLKDFFIRTGR